MDEISITIIGAGAVGLAIAAELSATYDNIVLLERHENFGMETSSRNSEVIHSGMYYPEDSLKTLLCREGAKRLYDLSVRHGIPHRKIGKLIIATDIAEQPALEKLYMHGRQNGVDDLVLLDRHESGRIEPNTNAIAAIFSPGTGIIDSHALMRHFYNKAVSRGVLVSFQSEVSLIEKMADGFLVGIAKDNYRFRSRVIINCAGLSADRVAALAGMDTTAYGYRLIYCKGSYFSYAKPSPVLRLVYPIPHDELVGLGIHATIDLGGRLRFGPDAEYISEIDYKIDASKRTLYYRGASKIIPGLEENSFLPDMAGIRPKLSGPGEKARDFIIRHEADNGFAGLINLIGIESPGLTASPAIAEMVSHIVAGIAI